MLSAMLVTFVVLLLIGMPLAFVMGITAAVGMVLDRTLPNLIMASRVFAATDSFALMAIPFFMLAGALMNRTGITSRIVSFALSLVGHVRGGLGHATTVTGVIMAMISGSANADSAAIGAIMLPSLRKAGYDEGFAVALVASAGVLAPIIPPSILMIIYASSTGIPVVTLFAAGFLPGFMVAAGYMVYTYFYARKAGISVTPWVGFRRLAMDFKDAIWALIMPIIVIGGILGGVFTATEAGAIAVAYGVAYGLAVRSLNVKVLTDCLIEAVKAAAGPMLIICFANMLTYMFTRENLSVILVSYMTSLTTDYYVMLFLIVIIILILGMFIEVTSAMLMSIPVLMPLIGVMGYDPLVFAMVVLVTFVAGGITPPVGIVLYIVSGINQTPLSGPVRQIWPFVCIILIVVVIAIFFPDVFTIGPRLLGLW
jgi:C4-dicarboxylate transporter DctM subunit